MAKRSPIDEKPFRPLDATILNSVVTHIPEGSFATSEPHRAASTPEDVSTNPRRSQHIPIRRITEPIPDRLRFDQEKRILFTSEESQALDRLIHNLAVRLNAQVKVSHVVRGLTAVLLNSEQQLAQRAAEHAPLVRPPNGDIGALQQFERAIARILASAIRDAGLPR